MSTYNDVSKKATMKYIREKTKRLELRYKTEVFEETIQPAIEASGLPATTFIKQAIEEKIARDGYNNK